MNVLYIAPSPEIGGAENSLWQLLKHLDRRLFQPVVVLPSTGPFRKKLAELDIETVSIPRHMLKARNPLPYLVTVGRLTRLMMDKRVDIVHCNQDVCNQYALPAARLSRVPVLCHTRSVILSRRAFRRMFLPFTDVLVAISQAVAASYAPYTSDSQRVVVIPNGVDLSEFSPGNGGRNLWRPKLGIPNDTYLIGLFGRIIPQKGHHVMVQALAKIAKVHPNVCLLVVGGAQTNSHEWFRDDAFLNDLMRMIEELELTRKVIFTGFIDNVVPLYDCLDVLVVPSLIEACGRTALEAMSMKKPIVASDIGPAREVVEDGQTALLVPPNEPDQLAAAILRLISDKVLAGELGENGRKRVEQCFTIEQHVQHIQGLYQSVGRQRGASVRL